MSSFQSGAVLKYNRLWRSGAHYDFIFFRVSHRTNKGTVMGHYLAAQRTNKERDHDYSTDKWVVLNTTDKDKTTMPRRLPHPALWTQLSPEELEAGIVSTSCVS